MKIYKISNTAKAWESMTNCEAVRWAEKLSSGIALTRDEKNRITYASIFSGGVLKVDGWVFDFRDHMKRYVVNVSGYGWGERYAFDKMSIRWSLLGVKEIVEVK